MNETILIRRVKEGDSDALGQLYERYVDAIFRFHYWQTNHHREAAEDLTQDTFLEAARSLPKFNANSSLKNWLYVIAKRQLAKHLRRKYLLPQIPLFAALSDSPGWVDPKEQTAKFRRLEHALHQLTDREAQLLRCRYLKNFTVKETAAALGLSAANVKVIQHRSLKKLRVLLASNQADTISMYGYAR